MYAFLFTVLALFIIPKGFLILDKLPSLNLGKYLLCTKKSSKIGDGEFSSSDDDYEAMLTARATARDEDSDDSEDEEEKLDRCSVLSRQLVLAIVEITLSILLFSLGPRKLKTSEELRSGAHCRRGAPRAWRVGSSQGQAQLATSGCR